MRAFHQLRELSQNYVITLFAVSEYEVPAAHFNKLKEFCAEVIVHRIPKWKRTLLLVRALVSKFPFQVHYFYDLSGQRKIKALIQKVEFNHIYCQLIRTSEYVKNIHHIPKTIDYMDALSAGVQKRIDGRSFYDKWLFQTEAKRLRNYERNIFDFFEHHTIISHQDRALIFHPDRDKIKCIPNGIDPTFFEELPRPESFDFTFVGNMSYPPNIDAVRFIAAEILPAFPDSRLCVSGATPHASLVKLAQSNPQIHITGWVDDIRESYLDGKIFLAPMNLGTGMQNKLLEAMALRTPCITTDLANNAIGATHGKEILVGNNAEELIQLIRELLADPDKRHAIADAAQELVKKKYSWRETTDSLVESMQQNRPQTKVK